MAAELYLQGFYDNGMRLPNNRCGWTAPKVSDASVPASPQVDFGQFGYQLDMLRLRLDADLHGPDASYERAVLISERIRDARLQNPDLYAQYVDVVLEQQPPVSV